MTGLIPRFCPHCSGPLDVFRIVEWGGWTYDEERRLLSPDGQSLILTPIEGGMVSALLRAAGRCVTKTGGLYAVACNDRPEIDWPDVKIVDVYISRVRRKLSECYGKHVLISTQWGSGYYATALGDNPHVPTSRNNHGRPRLLP